MEYQECGENMKKGFVNVTAEQIYRKKLFTKIAKTVFLALVVITAIIYFFLYIVYKEGNFTISLDRNMSNDKNVFLSVDGTIENKTYELVAESLDYMDNISRHWIPLDVDKENVGAHNGNNYIAYTFYVINDGTEEVNYWYQIDIDDTIKDVDKALRIMIYQNGVPTIYAKLNDNTKKEEEDTKAFYSSKIAVLEEREKFKPNDKDRYTVVVWIEGDDPDCTNDLLGGEVKLHMDITEEHVNEKKV